MSWYKGRLVGTIGDVGCFSLNDYKHISTGDGGMCLINDEEVYKRAFKFADKNYDRLADDMRSIDYLAPNYRMSELQGAVAIAQLDKLEWICDRRNAYGDGITKGISGLRGIYPPKIQEGCKSSYWFYMLRVNEEEAGVTRDDFSKALKAEGITNSAGYTASCVYEKKLLAEKSAYPGSDCPFGCKYYGKNIEYKKGLCPSAEEIVRTGIYIPVNEFYNSQDMKDVIEAINKVSNYY